MIVIKVSCDNCGEVEVSSDRMGLYVYKTTENGYYLFKCPSCDMPHQRPADGPLITRLTEAGVEMHAMLPPAEFLEEKTGDPLTLDDLIDLNRDLQEL